MALGVRDEAIYSVDMQFGICSPTTLAADAHAGGWDFIEGNAQQMFKGTETDWQVPVSVSLTVPVVNAMLPGALRVVGPSVDDAAIDAYMANVLQRAARSNVSTIVFGSGAARGVPDGFSRDEAARQITSFLKRTAPVAGAHGVTIVIEPLHRGECNIINTVAEAMTHVHAVDHPAVQCLVDSYHFWLENEPLENLAVAMPWIKHVHVADRDGRAAPGESKTSDYDAFFKVIKKGGYDARGDKALCSVECRGLDLKSNGPAVLSFLRAAWSDA